MDARFIDSGVGLCPEVIGRLERHVAAITVRLCFFRVVETSCTMTGDAAQHKRIMVVLASQKFVVIHRLGKVHFMAYRTKVGFRMERF